MPSMEMAIIHCSMSLCPEMCLFANHSSYEMKTKLGINYPLLHVKGISLIS